MTHQLLCSYGLDQVVTWLPVLLRKVFHYYRLTRIVSYYMDLLIGRAAG